ncbi:hypothetical protein ACQ3VF_19300 [Bacillus toyonensis]|uniref:hypothetical protein n=1 Tax=Bacillus toyonensis TaxID=155322 RepID=UPI003D30339B
MICEHYTLGNLGFNVLEKFPKKEREVIVNNIESINIFKDFRDTSYDALDKELAKTLKSVGYAWDKDKTLNVGGKHPCFLWIDTKHSVDFYNQESKIAIEVEKTEVKRIPHDVLKFLLASEIGKVEYGVLIIPKIYRTRTEDRDFEKTVKANIKFYFNTVIPRYPNLKDILFIVYDFPKKEA